MEQQRLAESVLQVGTVDGIFTVYLEPEGTATLYSASLRGSPIHAIAISPADPRVVIAGSGEPGSGLYYSRDGGLTWEAPGLWPLGLEVWALAFDPADPRVVLAGTQPAAIFRSSDAGYTWEELNDLSRIPGRENWTFPVPPHIPHVRKLAFDPTDSGRLLAAVEVGGLLESGDGGITWHCIPDVHPDVHSVAFLPGKSGVALAATAGGVWRSSGADSWNRIGSEAVGRYVISLAVQQEKPWPIYTMARGPRAILACSQDGGNNFQRLPVDLPAPDLGVDALALSPRRPGTLIYAGIEEANRTSIFVSKDAGQTWEKLADELHIPTVIRLALG